MYRGRGRIHGSSYGGYRGSRGYMSHNSRGGAQLGTQHGHQVAEAGAQAPAADVLPQLNALPTDAITQALHQLQQAMKGAQEVPS